MRSINLEQWIEEYKPIFVGEELKDFDLFKDELQLIILFGQKLVVKTKNFT